MIYCEDMIIQSRCGIRSGYYDLSKQYILDSVDHILKRLQTEYLDILLLHRPDALVESEEWQRHFGQACSIELSREELNMHSIYERRSIRKFTEKEVSVELINQVMDAGRVAPSAKNRQPWKYIVFGNKYKKELLNVMEAGLEREEKGITDLPKSKNGIQDAKNTLRIMKEAPIIIIVLNTNGKSPFLAVDSDDRITEICDTMSIGASIENMLLTAEEMGLGTLWIANTCFAYKELVSYLDTEAQLVGAIALGYANESPAQRPRKELTEIVEYKL